MASIQLQALVQRPETQTSEESPYILRDLETKPLLSIY